MGEGGISNTYNDSLMEKISYSLRGTFSIDMIPTHKNENFCIFFNLSKENEKGKIFIGTVFQNAMIYFDSYGVENNNSTIEKYSKNIEKNDSFKDSITTFIQLSLWILLYFV